jgi:hypothetical protein
MNAYCKKDNYTLRSPHRKKAEEDGLLRAKEADRSGRVNAEIKRVFNSRSFERERRQIEWK